MEDNSISLRDLARDFKNSIIIDFDAKTLWAITDGKPKIFYRENLVKGLQGALLEFIWKFEAENKLR